MFEWSNLTTCFGTGVSNPSDSDLKQSIAELFESNNDEHPDAWVECGSENGPLCSVSIYSSGYALFTKYSDADMSEELENRRVENVTQDVGLQLWKNLISGRLNKI
ncbi:hypothetical protein [Psychromonas antarctica]|uniref:hypothetical protein n=1 Tax=Psychromonas antarctica TaxID=67573 RepID=UPI001EE976FE|nr:hypothetical protein [Psychromonas antarctica]MCG6202748.1 hypothetical protein [Psychromonas antarctica]